MSNKNGGSVGREGGRTLTLEFREKKIDAIFVEINQCHLPGAAVGIAINGTPVYRKAFGLASMELPQVLTPATRMRIFSISKHFTCLAYMLLCEDGKAGIDDTVGKHFPEFHPASHKATMRQLMGNVSGLRDVCDIRWRFSGMERQISSAELLSLYRDIDDVNFSPGTAFCYNNGGFQLLSAAIERITGQSFEEVLRTRIFEPVGMHDTRLRRYDSDFVPNSASMHMTASIGDYNKSYLAGPLVGEGGIVSTVDDMLRWLLHMDAPVIGSAATWATMKAPQTLINGTSTGYGFGLLTSRFRGVETLGHPGGGMGANAQMIKVPAARLDIVIMVNRHDTSSEELAHAILEVCLPDLAAIKPISSRASITGTFRSPTTGRVVQFRDSSTFPWIKSGQQIVSIDGVDSPIELNDDGMFRLAGIFVAHKLEAALVGNPAKPSSVQVNDFGNIDDLVRVEAVDKCDIGAIGGRYRSDATDTEATIFDTDRGPRLNTVGRFGSAEFTLICLAHDVWWAKSSNPMGAILLFDDDGGAFRFSNLRTRALTFARVNLRRSAHGTRSGGRGDPSN